MKAETAASQDTTAAAAARQERHCQRNTARCRSCQRMKKRRHPVTDSPTSICINTPPPQHINRLTDGCAENIH